MSEERAERRESGIPSSDESKQRRRPKAIPGLVLLFADRKPCLRIFRADGNAIELGRVELAGDGPFDGTLSRKHVRVRYDGGFRFEDLASLNGTFVGGRRVAGEVRGPAGSTLRVGGTVLLAVADVRPFEQHGAGPRDGIICGPTLQLALQRAADSYHAGARSLLIEGERGTGKGLAARAFHDAGSPPDRPFVAVDCRALSRERAAALLFGTGSAGGATTAAVDGYAHAAAGGTLWLDEISALPTTVQSRLLRLLETQELVREGSSQSEHVEVRLCATTFRHLRDEVAAGRFRQDLYFRLGPPELRLPALRERLEEVPWHLQAVLDGSSPSAEEPTLFANASFVEACLLRPWPGNVTELKAEVERATTSALREGSQSLTAEDLDPSAGRAEPEARDTNQARFPEDDVAKALTLEAGNVLGAARRLGVHRNKVRRWLERHHVDAGAFKRRSAV